MRNYRIFGSLLATALLVAASLPALAQDAKKKAAEPAPAPLPAKADKAAAPRVEPAPPPAAPEAPKPAPELKAALDSWVGNWTCTGKVVMGGQEHASKMTMKSKWDLDNFWLVSRMEEAKAKGQPMAFKGQAAITYDPATKMFVRGMFDNMGGWGQDRSKGWEGDKMEFAGTSKAMGQDFATKETITKTGPKAVTVAGTMTMGGKPFGSWDMACKK